MRKKLSYSPLTKKTNALIVDPKISPVYITPMSHLKKHFRFYIWHRDQYNHAINTTAANE